MKRRKLLHSIKLGGDHTLKVVEVSQAVLNDVSDDDSGQVEGWWDVEDEIIYIRETALIKNRWNTYWHELRHAINDIADAEQIA